MRWTVAFGSLLILAACAGGQPISRQDAESRAATGYSSMHVDKTAARLMTWNQWKDIGLAGAGEAAGVADVNEGADQLVWAVALHDRDGGTGVVVVLDAVSGNQVMVSAGDWHDLPLYWNDLPDRAGYP